MVIQFIRLFTFLWYTVYFFLLLFLWKIKIIIKKNIYLYMYSPTHTRVPVFDAPRNFFSFFFFMKNKKKIIIKIKKNIYLYMWSPHTHGCPFLMLQEFFFPFFFWKIKIIIKMKKIYIYISICAAPTYMGARFRWSKIFFFLKNKKK